MKAKQLMIVENRNVGADARKAIPEFKAGDTVRVHTKVKEGEKERVQIFEGVVIRRKNGGATSTFTVRKVSYGVGVERSFPLFSPRIDKIERLVAGDVKRSRLFYLRDLQGKKARIRAKEETVAAAPAAS